MVAPAVNSFVKRSSPGLVALRWNGVVDALAAQIGSNAVERVSLIPYNFARQTPGSTSTCPFEGTLLYQLVEHGAFVLMTQGEHNRHRLTFSFASHVYLPAHVSVNLMMPEIGILVLRPGLFPRIE